MGPSKAMWTGTVLAATMITAHASFAQMPGAMAPGPMGGGMPGGPMPGGMAGRGFGPMQGKDLGMGAMGRGFGPMAGRDFGQAQGRDLGGMTGRAFGQAQGRDFGPMPGREFGQAQGRDFGFKPRDFQPQGHDAGPRPEGNLAPQECRPGLPPRPDGERAAALRQAPRGDAGAPPPFQHPLIEVAPEVWTQPVCTHTAPRPEGQRPEGQFRQLPPMMGRGRPAAPMGEVLASRPDGQTSGSTQQGNGHRPHGNNGVGNGIDAQPPGNPPVNDGPGTGPGNPGNRGGPEDIVEIPGIAAE